MEFLRRDTGCSILYLKLYGLSDAHRMKANNFYGINVQRRHYNTLIDQMGLKFGF